MKIACLQFNPQLGAVQHNISLANSLLGAVKPGHLDLLVLPELAFTGYNFPSLEVIKPYLEPTASGPTTAWAKTTARRLCCYITVGYPEISTTTNAYTGEVEMRNYNATLTVSPSGEVLANYRKSFLYYTDETWASEGFNTPSQPFFCGSLGDLGKVGHGICMDINPYRFTAPWTDFEFANRMLHENVRLVILSMAWLTHRLPEDLALEPLQPDMETVAYWRERFRPFIETGPAEEVVVVFANRSGVERSKLGSMAEENGIEGDKVCYAGSSCVMRFQDGGVRMFERGEGVAILGKAEEGVLVVDTGQHASYSLQQPGTR